MTNTCGPKKRLIQLDSKTGGNVDKAQPRVIHECHKCSNGANLSDHDPITLTLSLDRDHFGFAEKVWRNQTAWHRTLMNT
jgi:hypothetical protein